MNRNFPVSGLADLDRYLSALPRNMQKAAIRQALTAAAAPIRDEARLRAPKESGKMARSIKTGSSRQNEDGTFSVTIRLDSRGNDHAFLGYFFEYGIAPHEISRKAGKRGAATKIGGAMKIGDEFVSGVISHPGVRPHPFMLPALDVRADDAVKAFADRIRAFLEGKTGFAAPIAEAA